MRREPVNLWPRRIVTGAGLLFVIALIFYILWLIVRAIFGFGGAQDVQQSVVADRATSDGWVNAEGETTVPDCEVAMLGVTLSAPSQVPTGGGLDVEVAVENKGKIACLTHFGAWRLQVISGQDGFLDERRCEDRDQSETPLLLRPGATWKGVLRWDGKRHDGCAPVDADANGQTDVALPGTYTALIHVGEETLPGEQIVFEVR